MSVLIPPNVVLAERSQPLRVALEAALAGGKIIHEYFRTGIQAHSKVANQPFNLVTTADIESERAIAELIRRNFPGHEIVGEEGTLGRIDATDVWIIDPLDGTNNFAHRIPQFAASIAYYRHGQAECGVVVNPVRGDWYWAVRGEGAYHNGRRLRVSSALRLSESMVGVGFYYDRGAMMEATLATIGDFFRQQIHGIRRFGAAALDLCAVADAMFGAYFEYHLSPWDYAAGRLIVEEAGGMVTDAHGQPLPLSATSLLASNGILHPPSLLIIAPHHP
ncbi:MAG: inositol monophosphatase [Pirellulaceae bacterium]|nr:inositol monophosphatase [Pirellulaceae bacterium]